MTKVLLECEECGHRWTPSEVRHYVAKREWWADAEPCPKCHPPEPTYGPITVEMVAEMLWRADHEDDKGWPGAHLSSTYGEVARNMAQARTVIRLLKWADGVNVNWYDPPYCAAKLRELAKEQ